MRTEFYILSLPNQTAVATGTTVSPEAQIGNEYDFEIEEIRAVIYKLAATTGPVLADLKLSGGQYLTENTIDLYQFAKLSGAQGETEGYPIRTRPGLVIPANTKVIADIENNSGANINVQISFIGRKIYK